MTRWIIQVQTNTKEPFGKLPALVGVHEASTRLPLAPPNVLSTMALWLSGTYLGRSVNHRDGQVLCQMTIPYRIHNFAEVGEPR